jgi:hypothetical protein
MLYFTKDRCDKTGELASSLANSDMAGIYSLCRSQVLGRCNLYYLGPKATIYSTGTCANMQEAL